DAVAIAEAARQEGYRAGYEEGMSAGREAGRQEALTQATQEFQERHQSLVSACREIIDSVEAGRVEWQATARQDLIELAMAIARRIVPVVGERERQAVLANLEEAVRLAGARTDVTIAVN